MSRDTAILVIALYSASLWAAFALDPYTAFVLWAVAAVASFIGIWRQA
jgi:hypothetical protein